MPKRLCITSHLSIQELEQRYRQAKSSIERSHYQILWLLAQGRPSQEVAAVTGYHRNWIYELVRSYNQLGPEALGDLRRYNQGALPKLDDVQQANLLQAILGSAPDGGVWNGRKVADYRARVARYPSQSATGVAIPQTDGVTSASAPSSALRQRLRGARSLEKKVERLGVL